MANMTRKKKGIIITAVVSALLIAILTTFICLGIMYFPYTTKGTDYTIMQIDLSVKPDGLPEKFDYLYKFTTLDGCDGGEGYLAHPDSIILNKGTDKETVLTAYVKGHGRGEILTKLSYDGGVTYTERLTTTPESWVKSEETPTLYELNFTDGTKKLLLVSANPKWPGYTSGDGFNASISCDDGKTWTEFEKFYGKGSKKKVNAIVAMSSLTRLKENGEFVDKWMGLFHDNAFRCYKTILTFSEDGKMQWSEPTEFFENSVRADGKRFSQTKTAKFSQLCEIEAVRSELGGGDVIALLCRSNTKRINAMIALSYDEGETWTELKELPAALNGERHKAEYLKDGRLFITFRSVERDRLKKKANGCGNKKFLSEGWIAWVGSFDDLIKWYGGDLSAEGQYRIKLAHTYLDGQTEPKVSANGDTGYSGLVVMRDGTVVTSTYGRFTPEEKTFIVSKRLDINDLDELKNLLATK